MAEEIAFCEEILQVILSDPNLKVIDTTPQYVGTNLQGRSVILDARCILSGGKQINIEVQKADDDNHQKRVQYNGAILTTNITDPERNFNKFWMYVSYLFQNLISFNPTVHSIMWIELFEKLEKSRKWL